METISKERDLLVCCICHRKHGVCIKAESLQHGPDEVRRIKQIWLAGLSYLLRLQGLLHTIRMENVGGDNDDVGLEATEDGWAVLSQGPPSTTAPVMTGATMTLYYLWNLILYNSLIELNFK
ncbi:uncharacterized protein LOC131233883 isoform X2 [Magnolia sinica]|uniref:uncharacterized protein LOC131233883 isoform X2 n=1 Tax=Magnolia sinica TaxID=86752 RepID=UPI00265801A3|nr:uncharacterized protein LOC131233883 isoform X2 [Magnolia sinica]